MTEAFYILLINSSVAKLETGTDRLALIYGEALLHTSVYDIFKM